MIVEFRWHSHIYIYVAALVMLISGNRAKKSHRSYAESAFQLVGMTFNNIYVLTFRFH